MSRGPMTPEHKAKISAALQAYAARPECHLHVLHKSGEAHPNWRGGVAPRTYRGRAFAAYGEACQTCGSTRNLNVHHKDEDRRNGAIENLQVLCRSCHTKAHGLGGDVRRTTHCPQGHEYTEANTYTYVNKRGYAVRSCRECNRSHTREWGQRQKEARA